MTEREGFAAYRARLAAVGFRPSRRLGQNFLLQPELHRVIADTAEVGADDVVLEIGAGLGFLTRELARRASRVIAVEIDARLCEILRQELEQMTGGERVVLLHTDVLGGGGELAPEVQRATDGVRGLKVVANLPYAVTGPVLAALCTGPLLPTRMALLVQLEVAARLAAPPASSEYGSLSALTQSAYDVRMVKRVGRDVFRPRPNVDSGIVQLVATPAHPAPAWSRLQRRSFAAFVRALFSARRKKTRHSLLRAAAAAGATSIDPLAHWPGPIEPLEVRPGELDVPTLVALWRTVQACP